MTPDNPMTPEQKQIAIAEFDGISIEEYRMEEGCINTSALPPYLTSRDAICGVVARLPDWDDDGGKDKAEYSERLAYVVGANWSSNNVEDRRRIFEATPAQLSDALLLTLGYEL